jgi:hypothetical protein
MQLAPDCRASVWATGKVVQTGLVVQVKVRCEIASVLWQRHKENASEDFEQASVAERGRICMVRAGGVYRGCLGPIARYGIVIRRQGVLDAWLLGAAASIDTGWTVNNDRHYTVGIRHHGVYACDILAGVLWRW